MEYRKKCRVCGQIFCFTDEDLKRSKLESRQTKTAALATIFNAMAGDTSMALLTNGVGNNSERQIVDYSKCPQCGSRDISDLISESPKSSISNNSNVSKSNTYIDFYANLADDAVITRENNVKFNDDKGYAVITPKYLKICGEKKDYFFNIFAMHDVRAEENIWYSGAIFGSKKPNYLYFKLKDNIDQRISIKSGDAAKLAGIINTLKARQQ